MHAWNSKFVKDSYPAQMARWSEPGPNDTLWIKPPASMTENSDLASARDFGWAAVCASEVGDTDTVNRLLAYADEFLHPQWDNDAYYYKRHDELFDDQQLFRCMDPHTGNVLLGYARLNITDGLRKLYDAPWDERHFSQPELDDLSEHVDVTAAFYDERAKRLILDFFASEGKVSTMLAFNNIWNRGDWTLQLDGETVAKGDGESVVSSGSDVGICREADRLVLSIPLTGAAALNICWQ